jgi:hypothetical protein
MKIGKMIKQDIAKKATVALIAKERNAAYEILRKELAAIAERQFANVPVEEMKKFEEYIDFSNHLKGGENYPDGFKNEKRTERYKDFGFIASHAIPLLRGFPCKVCDYSVRVCDKYADDYIKAVRKYILVYFKAVEKYKLILESLNTISTDKQLADDFPELVIFYTLPEENDKQLIPIEKLNRCKTMLRESRGLFLESLEVTV